MHSRYLKIYAFTLVISAAPAFANYLYLLNNGEFLELSAVARYQSEPDDFVVYGTALHDDRPFYKLALYSEVKPKIISVGSSRVQQFRRGFFKVPFVNMGAGMSHVEQGRDFIGRIFDIHKPEVVIIGIDFWWFHSTLYKGVEGIEGGTDSKRLTLYKMHYPFRWLLQGKITFSDYVDSLTRFQNYRKTHFIGVKANQRKSGFGPDGSYYYTDYLEGTEPAADPKFSKTRDQIRNGSGFFTHGTKIDQANLDKFERILEFIHSKGAMTVLFFPPVAPSILEELESQGAGYQYISELKKELQRRGIRVFDFHDPALLDSGDCEFIDGYHGGDLVFAKIAKALAEENSLLRRYIAYDYVEYVTKNLKGLAMIPDKRVTRQREVDFLKMGCRKQEAWEHAGRAMESFALKAPS